MVKKKYAGFRRHEIHESIAVIRNLFAIGVFKPSFNYELRVAGLLRVLVCLNDLLQKANEEGRRVDFTDAVEGHRKGKSMDITDLINACRNAACHIGSPEMHVGPASINFGYFVGAGNFIAVNGHKISSEFGDDISFLIGGHRLLVGRNLQAAFLAVINIFEEALVKVSSPFESVDGSIDFVGTLEETKRFVWGRTPLVRASRFIECRGQVLNAAEIEAERPENFED